MNSLAFAGSLATGGLGVGFLRVRRATVPAFYHRRPGAPARRPGVCSVRRQYERPFCYVRVVGRRPAIRTERGSRRTGRANENRRSEREEQA